MEENRYRRGEGEGGVGEKGEVRDRNTLITVNH